MKFVGPWELEDETLGYAYREWVLNYEPGGKEILSVNHWLDRAIYGPEFVGVERPPGSGRWYGRVQGTNIVVDFTAEPEFLLISISKIAPPP